jgi:hypothetical protein
MHVTCPQLPCLPFHAEEFPVLFNELEQYAEMYDREPEIVLKMLFPPSYPTTPPFVYVVRPQYVRFILMLAWVLNNSRAASKILT